MEDDHLVWPPSTGARHRRTAPQDWTGAPARGRAGEPPYPPVTGVPGPAGGSGRSRGAQPPYPPVRAVPDPPRDPPSEAEDEAPAPRKTAPAARRDVRAVREEEPDEEFWGPEDDDPDLEHGTWAPVFRRKPGAGDDSTERPWGPRTVRAAEDALPAPGRGGLSHWLTGRPRREEPPETDAWDGPEDLDDQEDDWQDHGRDDGRRPWDSLPPSARMYGAPADPGPPVRAGGHLWRRAGTALALLATVAAVALLGVTALRRTDGPEARQESLADTRAKVVIPLPDGWHAGAVPPVTGFTSVARDGDGALVMARPVGEPVGDPRKAAAQAAELYSRLLLKGDRVGVVEDRNLAGGHTRALRAEYQDVVNRPAYLRVILLTRDGGAVLVVGLLQPEEPARRQALDALLASVR
ncbi:hypothetical protein ACIBG4_27575 [Nonomuraea sp. NPDC050383]|uniref:hypothetical protein n=1 Tax=Nonomuraea sp. NPDC050383 TaxID=3364362 RepID=UPI00379C046A